MDFGVEIGHQVLVAVMTVPVVHRGEVIVAGDLPGETFEILTGEGNSGQASLHDLVDVFVPRFAGGGVSVGAERDGGGIPGSGDESEDARVAEGLIVHR